MRHAFTIGAIAAIALSGTLGAAYAFAQTTGLSSQGIYGCNQNSAYAMSVGTMSATGGVYVPVNDSAVTVNTGTEVYRDCILRPVLVAMREQATAAADRNILQNTVSGKDGKSYWPQNLAQDAGDRRNNAAVYFVQNGVSDVNSAFRSQVTRAVAQYYLNQTQNADNLYKCPYQGDMKNVWNGADVSQAAQLAAYDPRCNAEAVAINKIHDLQATTQASDFDFYTRLGWNNGFYDQDTYDRNTNTRTVQTPGYLISQNTTMAVQSGYRQLQNANDVGQMVNALYTGLSNQIMSSSGGGLVGAVQGTSGQASYMDQIVGQQASGVRTTAIAAALANLATYLTIEKGYRDALTASANTYTQTIGTLQSMENQCWGLIIQRTCTSALNADNTCSSSSGTLRVATSTAFSSAVVNGRIRSDAQTTLTALNNSQSMVNTLTGLVSALTGSSQSAQQQAISTLDALVSRSSTAQGTLHTQSDLSAAQSQQRSVADSMSTLISDTKTAWADSTDPNVGWCNVNNAAVVTMWAQRWKQ